MNIILPVAAGGAFGAVLRFVVMSRIGHWLGAGFPWGTLVVNIAGSMLLGVFVELSALVWSPSAELRAFLVVGILGSFTTFSTFSLDLAVLFGRGDLLAAAGYVLASTILTVGGFFAGMILFRYFLT